MPEIWFSLGTAEARFPTTLPVEISSGVEELLQDSHFSTSSGPEGDFRTATTSPIEQGCQCRIERLTAEDEACDIFKMQLWLDDGEDLVEYAV